MEQIKLDQFLLGSKLGDGGFCKKSEGHNTYIVFKHCEEQYEYLNWKYKTLEYYNLVSKENKGITKVNIKEGSCYANHQNQYRFSTISSSMLNKYKNISDEMIVKEFTEEAFVVWLLDDGNIHDKVIKISCGSLSKSLCISLTEKIKQILNVDAYLYEHPTNAKKNYIRIPARYYDDIKTLVLKYVPQDIDIVRDKFHTTTSRELQIKIKYHKEQPKLCFIENKSDWIDLRAAETVEMKAGEFKLISLGVSMKLPEGYEAHVAPRSSTFKKWGIIQVNSMGIIDNSYCGDQDIWMCPVLAMRDTTIYEGDRICQFRIMKKQPEIEFIEVEKLDDANRGGFGSTGTH